MNNAGQSGMNLLLELFGSYLQSNFINSFVTSVLHSIIILLDSELVGHFHDETFYFFCCLFDFFFPSMDIFG